MNAWWYLCGFSDLPEKNGYCTKRWRLQRVKVTCVGGRFGGTRDVGRVCLLLCLANDPHWLTPKLRLLDPPSSPMVLARAPVFLCVAQTRFMSCAGRYLPKRRADEYELHGSGRGERRLHRGAVLYII